MCLLFPPVAQNLFFCKLRFALSFAISCVACGGNGSASAPQFAKVPQVIAPISSPAVEHIEIIIEENETQSNVVDNADAPYINNTLMPMGEWLSNYNAIDHPSQPNYLALYSGSEQGTSGTDSCTTPPKFGAPSLGGELTAKGLTVKGYMESIDSAGNTECWGGGKDSDGNHLYAHKHDPTIQFADTPVNDTVPYTQLATDIANNTVPSFAFIAPNQCDDGHDSCGGNQIAHLDRWLRNNAPAIIAYNAAHNGQLWVIFDEGVGSNQTVFAECVGVECLAGKTLSTTYGRGHYSLLRYIERNFNVPLLGESASATHIVL